jgi:hypothetical protein
MSLCAGSGQPLGWTATCVHDDAENKPPRIERIERIDRYMHT